MTKRFIREYNQTKQLHLKKTQQIKRNNSETEEPNKQNKGNKININIDKPGSSTRKADKNKRDKQLNQNKEGYINIDLTIYL